MKFSPDANTRRSDPYGSTRTSVRARHALLTPDGIVPGALPGWTGATCFTMISPAMGARFLQLHVELAADGTGAPPPLGVERVLYVLSGEIDILTGDAPVQLSAGGYAYLPPDLVYDVRGVTASSLLLFEKKYAPIPGDADAPPVLLTGHERDVPGAPFLGDPSAMLQVLLPDIPAFDMAVNIFKYAPGATLPFVETHVMEHGLLMLAGEGIYRLENEWYPVRAGDAIWMAPFCPQWFVATGKAPASYIYYKDVNRWPL